MDETSDLVAGGYLLTRPVPTPEYLSDELLPDNLLSAGGCISPPPGILPWAGGMPEHLGVPDELVPAVEEWGNTAFESYFGYPDVFYTLFAARKFVEHFIPHPPDDLVILCPALPRKIAVDFIQTENSLDNRGIYKTLTLRQPPKAGGTILGYEPLCYFYGLDHTWLCNELHRDANYRWRMKPNRYGFLDRYEDAQKVADTALDVGAEDGLWLAWCIIQYPPTAPSSV